MIEVQKPGDELLPNWVIVHLSDEANTDGLAELRWELHKLVLDGARNVIIDLTRVELLSSSALATLLTTHRACRARGGRVAIRGANRRTLDLLRHTGLHRVFEIEEGR